MKLGTKISLGFGAVLLIATILGGAAYFGAHRNGGAIRELGSVRLPGAQALEEVKRGGLEIKSSLRTLLDLDLSNEDRTRQYEQIVKAREFYQAAWEDYEALPRTANETADWQSFTNLWDRYRVDNGEVVKIAKELDELALGNPNLLKQQLQRFQKDHLELEMKVLEMFRSTNVFAGGEDDTQCNFGKWQAAGTTKNQDMVRLLADIRQSHQSFHSCVKQAKELVAQGRVKQAQELHEGAMEQAVDGTFKGFEAIDALADKALTVAERLRRQCMEVCLASETAAQAALDKLLSQGVAAAQTSAKSAQGQASTLEVIATAVTGAGLVIGIALAVLLTRSITRPVRAVALQLQEGADNTAAASAQVASSSQSLAEGASEQAASLEETSSSLEEVASMVKRNAENAGQAKALALEAREAAEAGAADMQAMGLAMSKIKESSDGIAKIIKTIDEIAFQTNILALNAAVEAARAGEAGMGFAVVADEVRNLAQRSAQAAKETATMIESAIQRSSQGVAITEKVTSQLQGMVDKIRKVDQLVAEVAVSSGEQSQGIDQVNTAVTQMDKVTQSTAASAEESASAAEELNAQAETLKDSSVQLMQMVDGWESDRGIGDAGSPRTQPGGSQVRGAARPQPHNKAMDQAQSVKKQRADRPGSGDVAKAVSAGTAAPDRNGFGDF